ncbi:class I adenylate-forming enzyme family protein [Aeromicrobium duanguangcaii]|uniref:Acyl--CoA ligase n=1 Tax=Aeromicrobium duanguangcaii TaxID=2968086 RepID=A0ABY5KIS8_9ACTN|nr:class I adenylate-forming enzyme family protein [Aeromicrobium duanguangcaii]MCD9153869.1 acyl--CoA ligase [Aeromicrobium duanguangcaii]UUI69052.1 acyl--CoA ligase [Aeromicrobium duanguangcaii]
MSIARGLHPQAKVREFQSKGWWTDETLDDFYLQQVRERPDRLAIVDPANRSDLLGSAPRRLTWAELDAEVQTVAARLDELGLQRGDVVGVQLPNTIELAEVYLGAWLLGIIVSPLPMQYREHEIVGMANQAGFRAFIGSPAFAGRRPAEEAAALSDRVPTLETVIAYSDATELEGLPDQVTGWSPAVATDEQRARVAERRAADPNDANDCATICWTSGTESEPKGVPRAHLEWIAISTATLDAPKVTADDVLLNPFPMVNMAGINGMFLPWLRTGGVLVQHHPFDLKTFLGQIAGERATYTVAPPALLWMLLHNDALLSQIDLSSLTRIGSGSAPLQPVMVRGWQEKLGIGVINFFGSNEGIALLSSLEDFPEADDRAQFFPRYGAPGVTWSSAVSEWVQLRLVDPITGEEVTEPGVPGELRIGGPTVFAGYLNPETRANPFDEQGMLKTGDIFEIAGDRNQFLRYLDRGKDLVIRGGMNIAPAEMEALIGEHPAVADVAVVGDPDEQMGERVAAVVTLNPGASLTLEELIEFLRESKIASYKLPERLEIRDELPRNPVGKVLKRELRRTAHI